MNESTENQGHQIMYGCEGVGILMMGAGAFAAGVLVGIGVGLLVAPHSGAYTRRQLRNLSEDVRERASGLASDAKEAVHTVVQEGKRIAG